GGAAAPARETPRRGGNCPRRASRNRPGRAVPESSSLRRRARGTSSCFSGAVSARAGSGPVAGQDIPTGPALPNVPTVKDHSQKGLKESPENADAVPDSSDGACGDLQLAAVLRRAATPRLDRAPARGDRRRRRRRPRAALLARLRGERVRTRRLAAGGAVRRSAEPEFRV